MFSRKNVKQYSRDANLGFHPFFLIGKPRKRGQLQAKGGIEHEIYILWRVFVLFTSPELGPQGCILSSGLKHACLNSH